MSFPRVGGLRALELGSAGSDLQRELNALVMSGAKRATAGLLSEYADEGEELESVGEQQYLIDSDGAPLVLIEYTRVEVVPFAEVTWAFARAEGEGFTDIGDWRDAHRRYWRAEQGRDVGDDEPVVCLWFEAVSTDVRLVVAAVVLTDDAGRVALVRKRGTQRFMLPGGKIEPGEAPEDCAVREAAEELGAHLDRDRLVLLGAWEAPAANEPGHRVHGHVFAHPPVAGLAPHGEIDELVWLLPEEADGRDDLAPLFQFRVLPVLRAVAGDGMAP